MILRYKGHWFKTDKKAWKNFTFNQKKEAIKEYFSEQAKYLLKQTKEYWIGFVDVNEQYISCGGYDGIERHKEIYKASIQCGRFNKGQWFSDIYKSIAEELVNDWEDSDKKKFHFYLDLGCGMSQQYVFTKKQKNMLIKKLKPLLEQKWYEDT